MKFIEFFVIILLSNIAATEADKDPMITDVVSWSMKVTAFFTI